MEIRQKSRQTWEFVPGVSVIAGAAAAGPREGKGPLKDDLDQVFPDLRLAKASFEQAEQSMQSQVVDLALMKAGLTKADVGIFFAGDLINQITPSCFTAMEVGAPFLGLFSACATFAEAVALSALTVAAGAANCVLAMTGSHTCTAERQFRYPNEYGCQKPPYSQTTVTAAGALLLKADPKAKVRVSAVTVGRVRDEKVTDPFKLGAAMAPAFADTVAVHLADLGRSVYDYDLILSGDLGREGGAVARDMLAKSNIALPEERYGDCGVLLTAGDKNYFAGGSGCGCSAAVICGTILKRLEAGELRRVLLVGTGALLSALTVQQNQSIPAIAHGIVLERSVQNG